MAKRFPLGRTGTIDNLFFFAFGDVLRDLGIHSLGSGKGRMKTITDAEEREFLGYTESEDIQPIQKSEREPFREPECDGDEIPVIPPEYLSTACCRSPEESIDLHGKTVAAAQPAINDFLAKSQKSDRHRCVLIITGKGSPQKGTGILRHKVPTWLKQNPRVRQYRKAPCNYGNEGAYCVVLRGRSELTKSD